MDQHDKTHQLPLPIDAVGRDRGMTRLQEGDDRIPGESALLRLDAHGGQRHEVAHGCQLGKIDLRHVATSLPSQLLASAKHTT